MYDIPSRSDVGRCVVDERVVVEKAMPTLLSGAEARPKAPRTRRAAS
jgi:ATP-dependent Clp protease ATP-binding subunit ClpX